MLPQRSPGVVLISEDPFVSSYLRCLLRRQGYEVLQADTRRAAEMVRGGTVAVDVLITNTPAAFHSCAEDVPLLYLSAAPDMDLVPPFRRCRVLPKPFHPDELLAVVGELAEPGVR